jgi:hypothetical protein
MCTTAVTSAATKPATQEWAEPVKLLKRIGSTAYTVNIHFSKSGKETLDDKIMRLVGRETHRQPAHGANPLQTGLPERSFQP